MRLWNKQQEKLFFINSMNSVSSQQLFYKTDDGKYLAYWPKGYRGVKSTLQSRNSLIGNFTENWVYNLFKSLIEDDDLSGFVNELENLMCEEVEISQHTDGSVSFSTFGEVPYSWRETFNEILKKNFNDVSVNINAEEESPLKIDLRNGELNEIPGETLVYYPGYEDELIDIPIRKNVKFSIC